MQIKERMLELIEDTAGALGYLIYESSILYKGENSQIHVKIDSLAGISHLDCEKFSRELSARLDAEEDLPNYSLEVSSPGLNRLLRNSSEFRRFPGAPVKVIYEDDGGRRVVKGTIGDMTDATVAVSHEKGTTEIPFDVIISANLDY
ncbi:MAG: ribosome maturation factor RimP [Spirochaetes bacterium]|nr:ribosome maturation factor RimP [Spirochaetota bacterium]